MEKIKVNMSPNPLDVQTIHASQNDGEARQWEFELHNNGELIDTSDVTEQMFFKAYKGGTEQLLPENTSTPTTSPFLGDIKYPQGLLTDQEFTYRQSPTEEDGLAKITDIKGNTLVWNQLVDTNTTSVTLTSGHKFITKVGGTYSLVNGTGQSLSVTGGTDEVFDLTLMFGSGNEPTTVEDFTSLFPLSYYSYNQGSLLSFMGNGIKTVGKNLFDGVLQNGTIDSSGQEQSQANRYRTDFIRVFPSTRYVISVDGVIKNVNIFYYDINKNFISSIGGSLVTTPSNCAYMRFYYDQSIFNANLQLEMLESGNNPTPYEPYTSSTLSLPISTYFPTGMKSAGNVFDEWTPNKATPRVGQITFDGTQTMVETFLISTQCRVLYSVPNIMPRAMETSVIDDGVISNYLMPSSNEQTWNGGAGIHRRSNGAKQIMVSLGTASGITTVEAWNAYLSAHPLTVYYPLESPTETSFTTASLVTENAEIPLSNEDGVLVGKCIDELSSQPGFIDAKIKLTDGDGTCYSNKIQLHVERKPS